MSNEVYDTLVAAKKLIRRKKNWIKGFPKQGNAFCAIGAMDEVVKDRVPWHPPPLGRLYAELPSGFFGVADFNDHPETTHRDVIRLFNRAIRAEKKRGLL